MTTVQALTMAHSAAVHRLLIAVGWNQPLEYMEDLLRWSGGGRGVFVEDQLVSCGMPFRYGDDRAWIGTMLTHPDHRGQGYASQVLQALIADLAGVREIMLDATVMGRRVYDKLGFRPLYMMQKWQRPPAPFEYTPADSVRPYTPADLPALLALDAQVFGVPRPHILQDLVHPDYTWVEEQDGALAGFLITTPRSNHITNLGSWIHHTPAGAERLLQAALCAHTDTTLSLSTPKPSLLPLMQKYGFGESTAAMRMILGETEPTIHNEHLYAVITMAVG